MPAVPVPIVAIATPPGTGAIAMIRLSGQGSVALLNRFFQARSRVSLEKSPPRMAGFGCVLDEEGRLLDEVLVTRFAAPASYTGEEMVEVTCHGGTLVTASILGTLLRGGARLADPGEFTQRAFLAGKLDLTQAEAVMDLIQAQTPLALRAATEQLAGRIGEKTESIRTVLLDSVARLEAWIDFPEEEIPAETLGELEEGLQSASAQIDQLLSTAGEGRLLREGVRLAICGLPNAGKSSILNCLLGFERAIVSEIPGTTRDTIEEVASLQGIPFRIVDTAGLRHGADPVEQEGILRARRVIEQADLVLEVVDATSGERGVLGVDEKPRVIAWNKTDLPGSLSAPQEESVFPVSCLNGAGISPLVERLAALAGHHQMEGNASPAAINSRHQACLVRARDHLTTARRALQNKLDPELISVDLRASLDAVGEVVGLADTEEILGQIFSTFCIGK